MKRTDLSREVAGEGSLRRFRGHMDRLFDSFFGLSPWEDTALSGSWTPDLEVAETGKEIVVKAEVPGLGPEDIDVRVTGNTLTLSGEKKEEHEEKKEGYYRSERRYGSFFRTVELPPGAKADAVTADYEKGVLTVRIAKSEESGSKRIEIKSRKE
jgi:HSP20 family protein